MKEQRLEVQEDYFHEVVERIGRKRHEIIDKFCEAYLAELIDKGEEIIIGDLQLVQHWEGGQISWYFEKREKSHE